MDQIKIGNYLRTLRTQQGLTQAQLAEIIGVSNRSISRWENGSTLPDLSLLVWLADYYHVPISNIIHGQETEESTMNSNDNHQQTVQDIVSYSEKEKKAMRQFFSAIFILGILLSMTSYFLLRGNIQVSEPWIEFVIGLGHGVGFGAMVLGFLITSGLFEKLFK